MAGFRGPPLQLSHPQPNASLDRCKHARNVILQLIQAIAYRSAARSVILM